jgi:mannose-6-phosphate isomerase-like protein (cupin superfamily)
MTFILLLLALQQPAAPRPATPTPPAQTTPPPATPAQPTPPAPAPRRTPPAATVLDVRVIDRSGRPIPDATVTVEGPARQEGTSDARGTLTIRGLSAGSYRVRADADGFVSLEKEMTVRGTTEASFALARAPKIIEPAPPPSPVAAPAPPPAPLTGFAGDPKVVSVRDLAEHASDGRDAVTVLPITCSGTSNVRLVVVRDVLPRGSHRDEAQTLYVVSGQAILSVGDANQQIGPGSVAIVPRGIYYGIEKKGRNPAVFLSVTGGQPCPAPGTGN